MTEITIHTKAFDIANKLCPIDENANQKLYAFEYLEKGA